MTDSEKVRVLELAGEELAKVLRVDRLVFREAIGDGGGHFEEDFCRRSVEDIEEALDAWESARVSTVDSPKEGT